MGEDVLKLGTQCCKVCGRYHAEYPWGEDGQIPTFAICDCCGVEFGYEDATEDGVKKYRELWIKDGARWFSPKNMPKEWNLHEQLKHVL